MATVPSTPAEFKADFAKFHAAIGDTSHTQEQIAGAWKCLSLRYLGLTNTTDAELETCADFLTIAHTEAVLRGWTLNT